MTVFVMNCIFDLFQLCFYRPRGCMMCSMNHLLKVESDGKRKQVSGRNQLISCSIIL